MVKQFLSVTNHNGNAASGMPLIPTAPSVAASKRYVDTRAAAKESVLYYGNPSYCWTLAGSPVDAISTACIVTKIECRNRTDAASTLFASSYLSSSANRSVLIAGLEVPAYQTAVLELYMPLANLQVGYIWEWDTGIPPTSPFEVTVIGESV